MIFCFRMKSSVFTWKRTHANTLSKLALQNIHLCVLLDERYITIIDIMRLY